MTAPDPAYFAGLQKALHDAALYYPTLVIDLPALDRNIDRLTAYLPDGMAFRVVAKSLPSAGLLTHIMERAKTDRLMTFSLPMLRELARRQPAASQLLGKPLPAKAVEQFLSEQHPADVLSRIQWLVDTPQRVEEYAGIANTFGARLSLNFELNVGLQRGGFEVGPDFSAALAKVAADPLLSFAGVMGYEPHIVQFPKAGGLRRSMERQSKDAYAAALAEARRRFGAEAVAGSTRNAAGSPSFRLWPDCTLANEVSVGSALVKPADFDTPLLSAFEPACYIAAPVLKVQDETRLPGPPALDRVRQGARRIGGKSVFLYGGNWLAQPYFPEELAYSPTMGRSSNQEMLHGPDSLSLLPDDFVFLRPTQCEAVFTHFGEIAVFDGQQIVHSWAPFSATG